MSDTRRIRTQGVVPIADQHSEQQYPDDPGDPDDPGEPDGTQRERDAERRRRRAIFLRELNEARELRARVQPRRARVARLRQQMRMRTFRW